MRTRSLLSHIPRPRLRRAATVALLALGLTATAHAQPNAPGAPGAPGGPGRGPSFFLAHTGDLQLSDTQAARLATIARRVETRRRAERARADSMRGTASTAGGRPALPSLRDAEQRREQDRVDLRDALGVLTADQQAAAWMLVSGPPPRGPGAGGGPGPDRRNGPGAPPAGAPALGAPRR